MGKSLDLFIVFGSESRLLNQVYKRKNTFFLKIYNNTKPLIKTNALSADSFDSFKESFNKLIVNQNFKKIIFLGSAFKNQNKLFFGENKSSLDEMIETNIQNYIQYTHFLLPFMLKLKSGQFIYLSSFRSQQTAKGLSIYSASKAFGEKFFDVMDMFH